MKKKVSFRASLQRDALAELRNNGYFLVKPEPIDAPQVRAYLGEHEPPFYFAVTVAEIAHSKSDAQLAFCHVIIRDYGRFQAWSQDYTKKFLKHHCGITVDETIDGTRYRWFKSFAEYTIDEMGAFLNLAVMLVTEAGLDVEAERQKYVASMGV